MFNNITCEKFHQDINSIIQNCQLPPVVAYYILKDCLNKLDSICREVLNYETNHNDSQMIQNKETFKLIDNETEKNIKKMKVNNQKDQEEAE